MNITRRISTAPFTSTLKESKWTARMKILTPNCTATLRQHILIWVRSWFILAIMVNLFSIGQFAVTNLLYGSQFQKQMLICSYKYFHLEKKNDLKKVIIFFCKRWGPGCWIRPSVYFSWERSWWRNWIVIKRRRGFYSVIENLSQVTVKKTIIDSQQERIKGTEKASPAVHTLFYR